MSHTAAITTPGGVFIDDDSATVALSGCCLPTQVLVRKGTRARCQKKSCSRLKFTNTGARGGGGGHREGGGGSVRRSVRARERAPLARAGNRARTQQGRRPRLTHVPLRPPPRALLDLTTGKCVCRRGAVREDPDKEGSCIRCQASTTTAEGTYCKCKASVIRTPATSTFYGWKTPTTCPKCKKGEVLIDQASVSGANTEAQRVCG